MRTATMGVSGSTLRDVARPVRDGELYDLESDRDELDNLWSDPGHRETRVDLAEQLRDVLVATEDRSEPRKVFW